MVLAIQESYYNLSSRRPVPAYIHKEKCWPEANKYSPCEVSCPLHMDVPNYILAIAIGDFKKALSIIRDANPLPSVCSRVCHHPCETECNRKMIDSPIAIEWLKRFATEHGKGDKPAAVARKKKNKVAIIGSGPAGLTAAYDLARKGYHAAIFEAASMPGGILSSSIPDFILPKEAVAEDIDYIKGMGVEIHTNVKVGKDVTLDDLKAQGFKGILIAIGAQKGAALKIPGADLDGVSLALPLLKEAKQGSLKPFRRKVWAIGGGAVAMDAARTALRYGASEVHIACLESRANMPAFDWEIEEAEREGVKIHPSLAPQAFSSKNGKKVNGINFKRVSSTWLDSEGGIHWTLTEGTGSDYSIDADAVIVAIGQATDLKSLAYNNLDVSRKGTVIVNELTGQTNVLGIFAAGDIAGTGRTVSESMAAGRRAALSIDQFLEGNPIVPAKEELNVITIKKEQIPLWFQSKERWTMPKLLPNQAVKTSRELNLGYTAWQAIEEARRCLNCRMCANCIFERGQLCMETSARLLV